MSKRTDEHDAAVIPSEENQLLAQGECGTCGWQGRRHRWWSDAQRDVDRHLRCNLKAQPASAETN